MSSNQKKVALIGNPNTGKSSLFNKLTGLNQRVGNYPGITVDKKEGSFHVNDSIKASLIDLPGTYSIYPNSMDEKVVYDFVINEVKDPSMDVIVYVAEVENIRRNLLLFTQLSDLGLPLVLVVNMADRLNSNAGREGVDKLKASLHCPVVLMSVKNQEGFDELKDVIASFENVNRPSLIDIKEVIESSSISNYKEWVLANEETADDKLLQLQRRKESIARYKWINSFLGDGFSKSVTNTKLRANLDKLLLHKFFGFVVFFAILLLIFQAVYQWSSIPMEWIDLGFANLSDWVKGSFEEGALTNLVSEGIIPGIGGVVIFIPQIAVLFLFIAFLEQSGYMSRVVFITDKIMRKFGLSGKSIIPLISGAACAIPAVMAARNIDSWKERLITVLVTPFVTCSARLPVYLMIIYLVIPSSYIAGVNLQAITLLILYLLGFVVALLSAYVLSKLLKIKGRESFVVEMPAYKMPSAKNIGIEVLNKTKGFVFDAGKIILAISIVLWFLASNGVGDEFNNAEEIVRVSVAQENLTDEEIADKVTAYKLEHSFIGVAGKTVEPVIAPLGYDWKIGIALISSFAAREVFIGSLATIYNVGSEDVESIQHTLEHEKRANGAAVFDLPTGISLLLFYAFAMQCMSTVAIVKKETGSWKWPLIQLFGMSGLAYLSALIVYQIMA